MEKYRFCKDCPDYRDCGRGYDLRGRRHHCGKAMLPTRKKIVTNADKIRTMSDEELAEFMCHNVSNKTVNCAFCAAEEFCRIGHIGWIDWLKQEC